MSKSRFIESPGHLSESKLLIIILQTERELPKSSREGGGWSGGAMVLGKYSEPKRPTNLVYSRARVYCTCSRCG